MPGVTSTTPANRRGHQPLHEQVDPHAQVEVEHLLAVLDEQVAVAASAGRSTRRPVAAGLGPVQHGRRRRRRAAGRRRRQAAAAGRGKRTVSPARSWPSFQRSSADHRQRAHEAAEAGAVGAEDDRHVAGEVDRADRVGRVVDVRRVQAGLAAVGARPLGLRADQADAGAGRVVVHRPRGGGEGGDALGGEEVGRRRAAPRSTRERPSGRPAAAARPSGTGAGRRPASASASPSRSTSPGPQRPTGVPAEPAEREGGPAAEVLGHVDAARAPARSPARPGAATGPQPQRLARAPRAPGPTGRPASPSSVAPMSAPARHTSAGRSKRRVGPVHRRTRGRRRPRGCPTARLPRRNDRSSIGPLGGTPTAQWPSRPGQSCTVTWPAGGQHLDRRRAERQVLERPGRRARRLANRGSSSTAVAATRGWSRRRRPVRRGQRRRAAATTAAARSSPAHQHLGQQRVVAAA